MSDSPTAGEPTPANGRELRDLKARAQRLDPILKIGKAGLSDGFYTALDNALKLHELVKVKSIFYSRFYNIEQDQTVGLLYVS